MRFRIAPTEQWGDDACPKSSDLGWRVTTCIAAIAGRAGLQDIPDTIVTASDTRASFAGEYSTEGPVKLHMIHKDWGAMIAGNDISQYYEVVSRAKTLLRGKAGDVVTVTSAFRKAYQDQRRQCITDAFLSPFDYTLATFKRLGHKQLLAQTYAKLCTQIETYKLGCTFLVFGIDDLKMGRLFTVRNPGITENYDKPGFWAIGNGASSALVTLSALNQVRGRTSFEETVYNVLAAKYFSEKASDVGKETYLWVQLRGSRGFDTRKNLESDIRAIWESEGTAKTPPNALEAIRDADWNFRPRTKRSKIQRLVFSR